MTPELTETIRRRLHAFWRQARTLPPAEESRAVEIELAIIGAHVDADRARTNASQEECDGRAA
ncbi:hypothetical protein [Elioraea sp.]|uniref:hypothetical protein n=1 Tax=Elioraea sp. TaxID=2185103 RepID=UPI003F705BBD